MEQGADLFNQAVSLDNLYSAYQEVCKGKSHNWELFKYSYGIESKLLELQEKLINGTWEPHDTVNFYITEPKLRYISRPFIEDRIVHHALMRVTEPYFESYFHDASYACRKGKGNLSACKRLQKLYRSALGKWGWGFYVIRGDFEKYFYTIDREYLKAQLQRIIPSGKVLILFHKIIDSYKSEGLPIGFLTSQSFANLVATGLDHYITDTLKVGRYYIRQMDDFRIMVEDKKTAYTILEQIDVYVTNVMHQKLSDKKTRYFPFKGKDTFCGYTICLHHFEPRTATVNRAKRRLRKKLKDLQTGKITERNFWASLQSLRGYLGHCSRKY